jgi:hypothetical protein
MLRVSMVRRLTTGVALAAIVAACGIALAPDYPGPSSQSSATQSEREGLTLTVSPMLDRAEQDRYFGTTLSDEMIIPIWLSVLNNGGRGSYILRKDNIHFMQGIADTSQATSYATSDVTAVASVALISVVGGFIADSMASNTAAIKANLENKELKTSTIAPGASAGGFIYVKSTGQSPSGTAMRVILEGIAGAANIEIATKLK